MIDDGNLFNLPENLLDEHVARLLTSPNVRIERIVSRGHASPPDFWYDQEQSEWVVVLAGSAGLLFEGEPAPRALRAGDHVHIPAHARHRVAWTDASEPTIWLAVHHR
jgi:cupin 2 domain-containing protein